MRDWRIPLFADTLRQDCFRVLLPVVNDFEIHSWLEKSLRSGLSGVLLGETRDEYLDRSMSDHRRLSESAEDFRSYVGWLLQQSHSSVLVAVDQEPWGIRRLHDLVPPYLTAEEYQDAPYSVVKENAWAVARAARDLRVSMFLSPVVDSLTGVNPWLDGRTLQAHGPAAFRDAVAAYVSGTQLGGVAAVAKHFPGFPRVEVDPAVDASAAVRRGEWSRDLLAPFRAAVRAGAAGMMLGPAVVEDVDALQPASTSETTVDLLRRELRFGGLVVSDDLDAPATLNGRTLEQAMIDSIRAGADLLLVAGGEHLVECAAAIHARAQRDRFFAARVHESASRVLSTARRFAARDAGAV